MLVRPTPATFDRAGARLSDMWRATARRLYIGRAAERETVAAFERRYVDADIDFRWMGGTMATCPLDLWVYQEIVHELASELIISTSASARYLAAVCQLTGRGEVVWIGAEPGAAGHQPRLREVTAPAGSAEALAQAADLAADKASVLVIVGAGGDGVLAPEALRSYAALVTQGSYLIVDAGAPLPAPGGAAVAVEELLRHDPGFVVDASREKFYLSFSRRAYLRRTGPRPPRQPGRLGPADAQGPCGRRARSRGAGRAGQGQAAQEGPRAAQGPAGAGSASTTPCSSGCA